MWFPQLDAFDAMRRMGLLLMNWQNKPIVKEHLYILDFYFCSPSLLHNCRMTKDTRKEFNALNIQRPRMEFIDYPTEQILYNKMISVQESALNSLFAKNILLIDLFEDGYVSITESGKKLFQENERKLTSIKSNLLIEFLVGSFSIDAIQDINSLKEKCGLRRVIL